MDGHGNDSVPVVIGQVALSKTTGLLQATGAEHRVFVSVVLLDAWREDRSAHVWRQGQEMRASYI